MNKSIKSSIVLKIMDSDEIEEVQQETMSTLTEDEYQLRKTLESQIADGLRLSMQGFYLIGNALKALKFHKLHRDTHRRFDEYAREKFNISKRYQHYLMNAVEVLDAMRADEEYFEQIGGKLPLREFQCRELLKLGREPEEWKKAWHLSLSEASGEVPTAKIVREVVKQINSPSSEENPFEIGDICLIEPKDNLELKGLHGCWAIIVGKTRSGCDVKTCLGLKKNISSIHLLPSAYTHSQLLQIKKICRLLEMIPGSIRKEEATIALLKIYGKRFILSDVEADLLTTLLKQ